MLSKIEILFIRACKGRSDSKQRLSSIYKRFYVVPVKTSYLVYHLSKIADKICPYQTYELIEVFTKHEWPNSPTFTAEQYHEKVLNDLIGRIATTAVKDIPGYVPHKLRGY